MTTAWLYGVGSSDVLAQLTQWQVSANTTPSISLIEDGGSCLMRAGAKVSTALLRGGFGEPTLSASVNPKAYWEIRGLIAELAAVYFCQGVLHLTDNLRIDDGMKRCNKQLQEISEGSQIGELTVTEGSESGQFYQGDYTDDQVDHNRFKFRDKM